MYTVIEMIDSLKALEVFKEKPEFFDLVITDMTMPCMSGMELARRIMETRTDVPIILCTGYSELVDEEEAKRFGIKECIMKPVVRQNLAHVVRSVINQSRNIS